MASRHPKKEVEAAIDYARRHGWAVEQKKKSHGLAWGVLRCSEDCYIIIWTTPRNAGNHAKQIMSRVSRCPHRTED